MASLLGSVTAASNDVSRKRKSSPEYPSSDPAPPSSDHSFFSSSGRKRYGVEEDDDLWGMKKPRISDITAVPDENYPSGMDLDVGGMEDVVVKSEPRDFDEDDDDNDGLQVKEARPLVPSTKVNRRVVNSTSVRHTIPKPEPVSIKVEPGVKSPRPQHAQQANGKSAVPGATHWSSVQDALAPQTKVSDLDEVKTSGGPIKKENIVEADGSLRIFWLDQMEQDGVVHLVGKVLDRQSGKYVSACVSVNGIKRNLFVKPRPKRFCE